MPHIHTLRFAVIAFVFVMLGFANVYACSCLQKPSLLESFDSSELVVTTKLAAVTKYIDRSAENGGPIRPTANMVVEKVYKGNIKVGEEIAFRFGGTDCDFMYDEKDLGNQFLFYLGKPESTDPITARPIYRNTFCSRPSRFPSAELDVAYLNNAEKYRGRTRVSGILIIDAGGSESVSKRQYPSVGGVAITFVTGKRTFNTISDPNGSFELYDLPPGQYEIHAAIPKGWKLNGATFMIREKQQSEVLTFIEPDTRISGRVVSATGRPIQEINVRAIPTDRIASMDDITNIAISTDKDGSFEIEGIMPGRCKIVANGNFPFNYRDAHYGLPTFLALPKSRMRPSSLSN